MKRIVRLYPSAWRRRYGAELTDLLEEMPATPSTTVDLLRGALNLHMRALLDRVAPRPVAAGGPPMPTHPLQRHPTASALIATLITAPTAIFVTLSFLAYQLELPGMQAWLQPFMDGLARAPRIVDLFLLGAPFLAFLLAALPLIGLRLERVNGELPSHPCPARTHAEPPGPGGVRGGRWLPDQLPASRVPVRGASLGAVLDLPGVVERMPGRSAHVEARRP